MTLEKWIIHPGESRVIDVAAVRKLKVALVSGQLDIVAHDEPEVRIEVRGVSKRDLRVEVSGDFVEVDHAQLRWDNFLDVFQGFGSGGPRAEVSIAVPKSVAVNFGVVSASALVAGLDNDLRANTVNGDLLVDGLNGDLSVNAVSGEVQVRGLRGAIMANSVSGDVAVEGELRKAVVDTVAGAIMVDAVGPVDSVVLNTVSGESTIRIDEGRAANFVMRSASGRILVDGVRRSTSTPSSYEGSTGELSGSFTDVRVNSVSGAISVLRRSGAERRKGEE